MGIRNICDLQREIEVSGKGTFKFVVLTTTLEMRISKRKHCKRETTHLKREFSASKPLATTTGAMAAAARRTEAVTFIWTMMI
jgi:hypothetical protein